MPTHKSSAEYELAREFKNGRTIFAALEKADFHRAQLLSWFFVCEAALPIQHSIGPVIELERNDEYLHSFDPLYEPHPTLNHVKNRNQTLWDEHGIFRYSDLPEFEEIPASSKPDRCLYLGNSFMEGFGEESIPWFIWQESRDSDAPVYPFNAGCGSYSPCIFVAQAKKLLPQIDPNLVVVSIDRTDIVDENAKRHLIDHGSSGSIVAVRSGSTLQYLTKRYRAIRQQPLYISRLASKLILVRSEWPAFKEWYEEQYVPPSCREYSTLFESIEPLEKLEGTPEVRFFADNLEDLLVTLSAGVGADRVLVTTHPHPGDLLTGDGSWNGLLTHVVASVARKTGVRHFDAPELLLKEGPDPIKNLYIPDDMHLNGDGLKVYARGIFNCIQQMRRPADH